MGAEVAEKGFLGVASRRWGPGKQSQVPGEGSLSPPPLPHKERKQKAEGEQFVGKKKKKLK